MGGKTREADVSDKSKGDSRPKPVPDKDSKHKDPGQREPFGRVESISDDEAEDLARAVEEQRDA